MIKTENTEVWGFEHAIRGMRNPMNSWEKSDSEFLSDCLECDRKCVEVKYCGAGVCVDVGMNDLELMRKLFKAGTEHRKFMRQIFVSMDITAPLYWWKEFDTYKVGTVANSCSTMHKIHAKEFELDDFSTDHLEDFSWNRLYDLIGHLNICRTKFIETKDKKWWWQMIQLLPSGYNQKRTITMTYENAASMMKQRDHHKLTEWIDFVEILKGLPYMKEITKK